jgi:hypothetical protein
VSRHKGIQSTPFNAKLLIVSVKLLPIGTLDLCALNLWNVGYAVAQFVDVQQHKTEGRGFDSRCDIGIFIDFRPHYGHGVDIYEYQGYLLGYKGGECVWLTTFLPSSANFLEILWEHEPTGGLETVQTTIGIVLLLLGYVNLGNRVLINRYHKSYLLDYFHVYAN